MLTNGDNTIAAVLGSGWHGSPMTWAGTRAYPEPDALRAQLDITLTDGTHKTIATDETWQTAPAPTLFSEIYAGEVYDARLATEGWNAPNFATKKLDPRSHHRSLPRSKTNRPTQPLHRPLQHPPPHSNEPRTRHQPAPNSRLRHGPEHGRQHRPPRPRPSRHARAHALRRTPQPRRQHLHRKPPQRDGNRHLHPLRQRRRNLHPRLHLPRLPLRRTLRLPRHSHHRQHRRPRLRQPPLHPLHPLSKLQRSPQQDGPTRHLGPARQLPLHPHRLPPARRASRLDGRRRRLLAHRHLQLRHRQLHPQVHARHRRRPDRRKRLHRRLPQPPRPQGRRTRLGRRRHPRPLRRLAAVRRQDAPRNLLAQHAALHGLHPHHQPRLHPPQQTRQQLRRLASPRPEHPQRSNRHRLLGHHRPRHERNVPRPRPQRRRRKISNPLRPHRRSLPQAIHPA